MGVIIRQSGRRQNINLLVHIRHSVRRVVVQGMSGSCRITALLGSSFGSGCCFLTHGGGCLLTYGGGCLLTYGGGCLLSGSRTEEEVIQGSVAGSCRIEGDLIAGAGGLIGIVSQIDTAGLSAVYIFIGSPSFDGVDQTGGIGIGGRIATDKPRIAAVQAKAEGRGVGLCKGVVQIRRFGQIDRDGREVRAVIALPTGDRIVIVLADGSEQVDLFGHFGNGIRRMLIIGIVRRGRIARRDHDRRNLRRFESVQGQRTAAFSAVQQNDCLNQRSLGADAAESRRKGLIIIACDHAVSAQREISRGVGVDPRAGFAVGILCRHFKQAVRLYFQVQGTEGG